MAHSTTLNPLVKLSACLWLACVPPLVSHTVLTSSHGTLVVIFVDQDKIVAGADSFESGEHVIANAQRCKISRLGDETFFVAAGDTTLAGHKESGGISLIFDAHQVASEAFGKFKNEKNSVRAHQMAAYWSQKIRERILNASRANPGNAPPISNIQGAFVSRSGGVWSIYFVVIDIFPAKTKVGSPTVKSTVKPWVPSLTQNVAFLGAGGRFAAEFFANKTPRAIAAQKQARDIIKITPSIGETAFMVESSIAAAEAWAPPEDGVGGDIDILERPRNGPAYWIQEKDECKK